jgi:Cu+-exporting ATPase
MEHKEHKIIDPVCGMEIDPEKAAAKVEYQGKTYYFCAVGCKTAFERDPEKYLKKEHKEHEHGEHHGEHHHH